MIIYEKLKDFYGINLRKKIGRHFHYQIRDHKFINFWHLCKRVKIDSIGYTYNDFLIDYKEYLEKFKYKKVVFKILKTGLSINEFALERNLNHLYRCLKGEREFSEEMIIKMIDIFPKQVKKSDIKNLKCIFKKNDWTEYCILYGEKEELEKFKLKLNLKVDVIDYESNYHMAFNGLIYEELKLLLAE